MLLLRALHATVLRKLSNIQASHLPPLFTPSHTNFTTENRRKLKDKKQNLLASHQLAAYGGQFILMQDALFKISKLKAHPQSPHHSPHHTRPNSSACHSQTLIHKHQILSASAMPASEICLPGQSSQIKKLIKADRIYSRLSKSRTEEKSHRNSHLQ